MYGPKIEQNGPKSRLNIIDTFLHYLEIASLVFANFAYDDRQAWYITGEMVV